MLAAVAGYDWSGRDGYVTPLTVAGTPQAYPLTVAIHAVVKRSPEFAQDTRRTLNYLGFLMENYGGGAQPRLPAAPPAGRAGGPGVLGDRGHQPRLTPVIPPPGR